MHVSCEYYDYFSVGIHTNNHSLEGKVIVDRRVCVLTSRYLHAIDPNIAYMFAGVVMWEKSGIPVIIEFFFFG